MATLVSDVVCLWDQPFTDILFVMITNDALFSNLTSDSETSASHSPNTSGRTFI
jgi:hypothetical protein